MSILFSFRYLATGCTFIDLEYSYRCGSTTIGRIVQDVCQQIWINLKNICIPEPTEESWLSIANGFERRANFPNCIGAIDGKHIRIVKPTDSGSSFFNYKKYFSFVLLAICDSNYMFTFVDIGSYGRHCDSTIFKESIFYTKLQQKTLNIPPSRKIIQKGNSMPYVFVGDEAFSLSENLLRPYGGNNLSLSKRIFNYRLVRARRYIECSFGVLANKWRIFHRPLNVSTVFAIDIVKACCILHNYVRCRDGYRFEDTLLLPESLEDPEENLVQIRPGGRFLNSIRDQFLQYFISDEGKVDWQLSKI